MSGPAAVDLVGPHGYVHGYHYVGGPGLPKAAPARSHHGPGTRTQRHVGGARRRRENPILRAKREQNSPNPILRAKAQQAQDRPQRLSQYAKQIGPNMGQLGKAARGNRPLSGRGSNKNLGKEGRAAAFKAGHALPPASPGAPHGFPITSPKSWEDARRAVGRVKSPARREALRGLLRRTAAQYGKTAALKASWAASNTLPGLEFAVETGVPPQPITGPLDLIISRDPEDGTAVVRHRKGGGEVGRIRHDGTGWVAAAGGKDLSPHPRQRGALLELIGVHNTRAPSPYRRMARAAEPPLQPRPQQTDLMRAYGIPAITALAGNPTAVAGASDGPRTTTPPGLNPKGVAIYGKLRKRGFPHARAHGFARRAQNKGR